MEALTAWLIESDLSLTQVTNKLRVIMKRINSLALGKSTSIVYDSQATVLQNLVASAKDLQVKLFFKEPFQLLSLEIARVLLKKLNKDNQLFVNPFNSKSLINEGIVPDKLTSIKEYSLDSLELKNTKEDDSSRFLQLLHYFQEQTVKYQNDNESVRGEIKFQADELAQLNEELRVCRSKLDAQKNDKSKNADKLFQRTILKLQDLVADKSEAIATYDVRLKALKKRISDSKAQLNKDRETREWLRSSIKKINSECWKNSRAYRKKIKKYEKVIIEAGIFDSAFYQNQYPDVERSQLSPCLHYLLYGAYEGRRPSSNFNPNKYLVTHSDIVEDGMEPLLHYALYGMHENRNID